MQQRFETPAAHRIGDGLMAGLWQMILPASLFIVFGLAGAMFSALELPNPAFVLSLAVTAILLLYVWVTTALRWLRTSAGWGMDLHTERAQVGSRDVPYDDIRTIAIGPLNPEKPTGDLGLMIGIGDALRESRVVLSHREGLSAFEALRARCPGAIATDLEGVDHMPADPELRAEALRVLGRRRVRRSVKSMIVGVLVTAWGALLLILLLFNDSKPLSDKLEVLLFGLALLGSGGVYLSASVIGWKTAQANLAEAG